MIVAWLVLALAEECADCHVEQAWAHGRSRHAQAFANPSFQAAFTRFPDPWCLSCHPREGLGCEACHGEGPVAAVGSGGEAPHPVRIVPDLGTSACAGCHGFTPPDSAVWLQATAAEHVPATGSCADCHFPLGDHSVRAGARDVEAVRKALSVAWRRDGGWVAEVRAAGVGHAVPTGDPSRQLLLEVGAGEQVLARQRFGRFVEGVDATFRVVGDTRIPSPGPDGEAARTVSFDASNATWWRLRFELVDPAHTELQGLEAGWVVHEGSLPSTPGP